jgi:LmbE family N-acetylglucosaminyl deacetylase
MAKKILIISAHPDDETIGMGGTMLKHKKAGDALYWLITTSATKPRWSDAYISQKEGEIARVAKFFGMKKTFSAGFPAIELNTVPTADLCEAVSKVIRDVKPDVVYCPPPEDINNDHAAAFNAARVSVRGLSDNPVKEFLAYEIPTTTRFCDNNSFFVPNCYVDVSKEFKKKLQAFALYKTENRKFPHPRSPKGLEIAARERGLALSADYAEAFIIVKSLR